MLSLVLDWQKKKFEFMGQTVTAEIRPLKRLAMIELLPYMNGGKITIKESLELQGIAGTVFPEHVRNVEGIEINGQAVTMAQLSDEMALYPLTTDIIKELALISSLKDADEGNLEGVSGNKPQADTLSN
jgi:hypothetical protein